MCPLFWEEMWPLFWEAMYPYNIQRWFFYSLKRSISIGSKLAISATDTCLFTNHTFVQTSKFFTVCFQRGESRLGGKTILSVIIDGQNNCTPEHFSMGSQHAVFQL